MDLLQETNGIDLLLIAGVQGSGKTHLTLEVFRDRVRVNLDEIRFFYRHMTTGRPFTPEDWTPRLEPLFADIEERIIRWNLAQAHPLVVDNTNIVQRSRSHYRKLTQEMGKTIGLIYLDVPVDVCLNQNHHRRLRVPEGVVREFHERRELPSLDEGFDYLRILHIEDARLAVGA